MNRGGTSARIGIAFTALLFFLASGTSSSSAEEPTAKLGSGDIEAIQQAEDSGRARVTLLIAARENSFDAVEAGIRDLGGVITGGEERIGYVKASVPTGRAVKASRVAGIQAVDVDRLVPLDDPVVRGQASTIPQNPPGSTTPRANPYMPVKDFGADVFTEDEDRDGRGVKVAVLDTGVDLNHPALATTTDSAPKVVDWFDANSPTSGDGTWIATEGRLNGSFVRSGQTWKAPTSGGPFAFGTLVENRLDLAGGEVGGDLNRNGVIGETFGVLQNRSNKEVRVDTDRDRDFTDEAPMLDYKAPNFDVGVLGTDNPATLIKEAMTFTVGTTRSVYNPSQDTGSWVNIGIAGGSHGSHVAGIVAANEMFGGAMSGAAPGAQIMSIQVCLASEGCTGSGMMDGMVYAAENGADVANMSVGGLPPMNDGYNGGTNARAVLYNNLIDEYNMQIFVSAGNEGSGANTVGDPSVADDVLSVGASVTKGTWLSNYGSNNETELMLMPFSSRGPSENGAMKPEIVAPGSAVSTIQPWLPGDPVPGTFGLPPGYAMYNGTSMSSPQAAGAAALLVGAYKNEFGGQRPAVADLRNALVSTADFIPGVPAHGQGTGQINVQAAWAQLSEAAPVAPAKITARVPVKTVLSQYLEVPNVGKGIHEREGVNSGDELTRIYTLTRTTGPAGLMSYEVSWKGNDGTFSSTTDVTLPLNVPVEFPVDVQPETPGIHAAVMQIDDPATNGIELSTQNVVFATDGDAGNQVEVSGQVGRGNSESVLIDVPPGASALQVKLDGGGPAPADGQVRFLRQSPDGINVDEISSSACFNPNTGSGCPVGSPTLRVIQNPMPGVWEIAVEGFRNASVQNSPFTLTASILKTSVSPNPDHIVSPNLDPVNRSYEVSNEEGAFTGRLAGGPLASTRTARPEITMPDPIEFEVQVPSGTESISAKIGNSADPDADLDLYLYRCQPTCVEVDAGENSGSEETVSLDDPTAGRYLVEVSPYDIPAGSTEFDYEDSFVNPAFGEVVTDDSNQLREAGDQWTVNATISPKEQAGSGRTLIGALPVLDETGSVIGRGSVEFELDPEALKTTITKGPASISRERTPTFEFTTDVVGMTFECRVDTDAWQPCTSPHTTAELSDGLEGDHRFEVRGIDPSGIRGNPASADFTISAETALAASEAKVAWSGSSTRITPSAKLTSPSKPSGLAGMPVMFMIGSENVCSASTDGSGIATCSGLLKSFDPGLTRSYRAVFSGERRLGGSEAEGALGKRSGNPPDRVAPRIIGKLQLRPVKPKAGKPVKLRFRTSEAGRARLIVSSGKVRKASGRKVKAGRVTVPLPRLNRGSWSVSVTVKDAAGNRSAAKKLKFRVR